MKLRALLLTSVLFISGGLAIADTIRDEQLQRQMQVLDNLDARIDQEEASGFLRSWQANSLRDEVQTLRLQEGNYIQQDAFDAKAAAIAQQLDPPFEQ